MSVRGRAGVAPGLSPGLGLVLGAILSVISGCIRSTAEIPGEQEGGFISGTIVERDLLTADLKGKEGVAVRVLGTSISASSNAQGFFQLQRIPLNENVFLLLERRDADGRVVASRLLEPVSLLVDGQNLSLGQIRISGTGNLLGAVFEGRDQPQQRPDPAAGALAVAAQTNFKAVAAEDGSYLLPGLPQGAFDVVVFQPGFSPGRVPEVGVVPGAATLVKDVVLRPVAQQGQVPVAGVALLLGEEAGGHAGIEVQFQLENDPSVVLEAATTDGEGNFAFALVPVGVYRVRFSRQGYLPVIMAGVAVLDEGVIGLLTARLLPSVQGDNDGDGFLDDEDLDDDNDGCPDTQDAFPFDPFECADNDGDGTGDNEDIDDDNDGLFDFEEVAPGKDGFITDPFSADTDADGTPDADDPCPTVVGVLRSLCTGTTTPTGTPELQVTGFAPSFASAGAALTIFGQGFGADLGFTAVRFGQTGPIVNAQTVFEDMLIVEVPANAIDGPLSVFSNGRIGTSTGSFDFREGPEVIDLSPGVARVSETVAVYGRRLAGARVFLSDRAVSETPCGAPIDQIATQRMQEVVCFIVPQGGITGPVRVETDDGAAGSQPLLVVLSGPLIVAITPNPVPEGEVVNLIGDDLEVPSNGGEVQVRFQGVAPITIDPLDITPESIRVVVPQGAQTGPVELLHPAGDSTSLVSLEIDNNTPAVSSVDNSLVRQGDVITVFGTNLDNVVDVDFGGGLVVPPSATSPPSSFEVQVPVGIQAGTFTVNLAGGVQVPGVPLDVLIQSNSLVLAPPQAGLFRLAAKLAYDPFNDRVFALTDFGEVREIILDRQTGMISEGATRQLSPGLGATERAEAIHVKGDRAIVSVSETQTGADRTMIVSFPQFVELGSCPIGFSTGFGNMERHLRLRFAPGSSPVAYTLFNPNASVTELVSIDLDKVECQGPFTLAPTAACPSAHPDSLLPELTNAGQLYLGDSSCGMSLWSFGQGPPVLLQDYRGEAVIGDELYFSNAGANIVELATNRDMRRYPPLATDRGRSLTDSAGAVSVQSTSMRWLLASNRNGGLGRFIDLRNFRVARSLPNTPPADESYNATHAVPLTGSPEFVVVLGFPTARTVTWVRIQEAP